MEWLTIAIASKHSFYIKQKSAIEMSSSPQKEFSIMHSDKSERLLESH